LGVDVPKSANAIYLPLMKFDRIYVALAQK
jgi:hypothetical protein